MTDLQKRSLLKLAALSTVADPPGLVCAGPAGSAVELFRPGRAAAH